MEPTATISPNVFLIVIAITVLVSLIAGYVARIVEERQKPADQPQSAAPEPGQVIVPEEHTALKVTLDKGLAWQLEVDGARVAPNELTAEQRARLVNIIVQIRPWIDGKAAPAPAAPAPTQLTPPVAATVSMKTEPPAAESDKLKIDVGRGFRSLFANDLKVIESAKPTSIVSMIDDFLQKRLAVSPLANREIHLEEGALGEVVVFVGKERFAGVEAVSNPEIQSIIRAAIKDWEKSS